MSFSDEKKSLAGLLTPPDSPQTDKGINNFAVGHSESFLDLGIHDFPPMMHVHKKTHQSLKGLLKRTYQLNQYTVSKTNSVTLPHSAHGELLYKIIDSLNGKHKFLLKIIIVSLDKASAEKQRRFGFTFWWQNQYHFSQEMMMMMLNLPWHPILWLRRRLSLGSLYKMKFYKGADIYW